MKKAQSNKWKNKTFSNSQIIYQVSNKRKYVWLTFMISSEGTCVRVFVLVLINYLERALVGRIGSLCQTKVRVEGSSD